MRILAFSDTHGSKAALKDAIKKSGQADILVGCGDFTIFGHQLNYMLLELNRIGKQVYLVHGNHEMQEEMKRACERHRNIHFIHKEITLHDSVMLIGYGGGGFSTRDEQFERFAMAKRSIVKSHKGKVILVTHGPPYGTKQDEIMGGHCGSKSYREFAIRERPDLMLCGHIHENAGTESKLGKTIVMNPGPKGIVVSL
jgi:uncharacterized protein